MTSYLQPHSHVFFHMYTSAKVNSIIKLEINGKIKLNKMYKEELEEPKKVLKRTFLVRGCQLYKGSC